MEKPTLCIVGLGYVGLPLAHAFAKKKYSVYGYDKNSERIQSLKEGADWTGELSKEDLDSVTIELDDNPEIIAHADIIIVALPTPVDENKKPDLSIVKGASKDIGEHMKDGAIIVYESTVAPGTTEDICGPIVQEASGGKTFKLGYSPERINPGDKEHTVSKIIKVVAGQDEATTDVLCDLYNSIITAGIHRAPNIKTAEMSKAIENAQRDLNIAYINEITLLCHKIGINSEEVLEAAGTKWNFLQFTPGLVGGHCIGVDPYYLVEKAEQLGMQTHVISAGRAVNDNMANMVAQEVIDQGGTSILVLGLSFKENVPDDRNSQSYAVITALEKAGKTVSIHDPYKEDISTGSLTSGPYDAIVLLVKHKEYLDAGTQNFIDATNEGGVIYDVKGVLDKEDIVASHRKYLSL